jgi:hypothetical protein
VQKHPAQPAALQLSIEARRSVLRIAPKRVPGSRCMDPNLVRSASLQRYTQQRREPTESLQWLEASNRALTVFSNTHPRLPAATLLGQCMIDPPESGRPAAGGQRQIIFVHPMLTQQCVQCAQCTAPLCHQQAAGGFPVQAVHELEITRLGTQHAQRLDTPKTDTTATVHGQPGGFIEQ